MEENEDSGFCAEVELCFGRTSGRVNKATPGNDTGRTGDEARFRRLEVIGCESEMSDSAGDELHLQLECLVLGTKTVSELSFRLCLCDAKEDSASLQGEEGALLLSQSVHDDKPRSGLLTAFCSWVRFLNV